MKNKIWEIYKIVIDWIKFADAKAGLLLALNTGIALFIATCLCQEKILNFILNNSVVK